MFICTRRFNSQNIIVFRRLNFPSLSKCLELPKYKSVSVTYFRKILAWLPFIGENTKSPEGNLTTSSVESLKLFLDIRFRGKLLTIIYTRKMERDYICIYKKERKPSHTVPTDFQPIRLCWRLLKALEKLIDCYIKKRYSMTLLSLLKL